MSTGYNYVAPLKLDTTAPEREAIRVTVLNYFHHQLGWSLEACERRLQQEEARLTPKGIFDFLSVQGWRLKGSRVIDVGSGQGAAVVEAFLRGAECCGVEPGDEFRTIARMRLKGVGGNPECILGADGERIPFPDASFDYAISLQVLEHVNDPLPIMSEIFRVLKPGGECYISCENYLSFREQHYRVAWLPLLPKSLGAVYLRILGRNPAFLRQYVHYTTYPQIWRLARQLGFVNLTYDPVFKLLDHPKSDRGTSDRLVLKLVRMLPVRLRYRWCLSFLHLSAFWRVGVAVRLMKPRSL